MSRSAPTTKPAKAPKEKEPPVKLFDGDGSIDEAACARADKIMAESKAEYQQTPEYRARVAKGHELNQQAIADSKKPKGVTPHDTRLKMPDQKTDYRTAVNALREFVGRQGNLYTLCQMTAELASKRFEKRNGGNPMSPAMYQAMVTSIYDSAEARGLADGLPSGPLDEYLKKEAA